ncbi:hypothetical protein Q4Q39_07020 [Flavivirga amylovorans]|uniref:Uncharacterized protein n=1 Tax=Flavivirga amylovorans TaxID=870486 RepID=A0ABT8X0A1_9FLAO|nr:hypothetical protein [Flavivirga amylovorans]MDO5987143.1 hypothetical protein [Flavivirga amylovorans]
MKATEILELGDIVYDQRDISPAQLDVTSRQINYWIDEAIVPFVQKQQTTDTIESKTDVEKTKTKWIRLNLAQAVWVSIVKELFQFKVSSETLKELAKKVWQDPREKKHADKVFKYHIDKNPNGLLKEEIIKLKNHIEDELLMEHHFRTIINPFTDMIKSAIERTSLPYAMLCVPETNDYDFRYGDNSLIIDLASVYLQKPMISLPLTPIIAKVLSVDFDNRKKKDLNYLSNVERQIRDIVVFKRPKIVEIAFENNDIKPIIITEQHKSREQLAQYILENKIAKDAKLLIDIRSQDNYKITLIKK